MIYRIKNWQDFQHYKDRAPPWIKLHNTLLTSEVWVMGNDATRALVVASMLLASRNNANDGTFNGDPEYVKRFAYLNSKPDFNPLIQYGFIELVQDASTMLATCNTEERREEERREEKPRAKRASQIPSDFTLNETSVEFAKDRGVNITTELESFRDYHAAKGSTYADWQAAWRTWCKKAVEFGRATGKRESEVQKIDTSLESRCFGMNQMFQREFDEEVPPAGVRRLRKTANIVNGKIVVTSKFEGEVRDAR